MGENRESEEYLHQRFNYVLEKIFLIHNWQSLAVIYAVNKGLIPLQTFAKLKYLLLLIEDRNLQNLPLEAVKEIFFE